MKDALGSVQSALVLGGSSDIAVATVKKLIQRRTTRVVLAGRDRAALERAAKDAGNGAAAIDIEDFDARDHAGHQKFVREVWDRHGGFDLVLVAFGVLGDQEEAERDIEAALTIIDVNYVGAVSVLLPVAERMKAQGHGSIVVLSSVAAERARKANFIYSSSKAGIDAFCQGLTYSLDGTGVRLLIVRPGFVHTKMTEGRKAAPFSTDADSVADSIMKALAKGSEEVWAPGGLRWFMSAMRHTPRPIFRRIKS